MKKYLSLPIIALALFVSGCSKTESEKFDDEFDAKQAEIEAKAKEIEEEGSKDSSEIPPA